MISRFATTVLALSLVAALTSCAKPRKTPPSTLDSPQDVEIVRVCTSSDDGIPTVRAWDESCLFGEIAYALIANTGNRFVQVARIDTSAPSYVDFAREIPGNTGIAVPDGPVSLAPLHQPTMVAVASVREPALAIIEFAGGGLAELTVDGQEIGERLALPAPPGDLSRVDLPDGGTLVSVTFPTLDRVSFWRVSAECGAADASTAGCVPKATLVPVGDLDLPSSPVRVAMLPDGRAWIAVRGAPGLWSARVIAEGGTGEGSAEGSGEAEPGATEDCANTPCLIGPMDAAHECSDGVDNDGDGLIDADDPQCFGPTGAESPSTSGGLVTVCNDGVDNDGDGAIDADDAGCRDALDGDESGALDGTPTLAVGTGSATRILPSMQDTSAPDSLPRLPRCRNGEDDDGDGAVDWPDDADCYGPNDDAESPVGRPWIADIALTEEGDILAALDRRAAHVSFYETATNQRIRTETLRILTETRGAPIFGQFPGPILTDTTTATVALPTPIIAAPAGSTAPLEYTHARLTERRVHVATGMALGETVVIDRTWEAFTGIPGQDGVVGTDTVTDEFFEPLDLSGRSAEPVRVDCSLPILGDDLTPDYTGCADGALPRPVVSQEVVDACGAPVPYPEGLDYWEADPSYFVALSPTILRASIPEASECAEPPASPIQVRDVPHDMELYGGLWEVVFEGVLNGTARTDALLVETDERGTGWFAFPSSEPCGGGAPNFCSSGAVTEDLCPALAELCSAAGSSAAVCDAGVDVCALCPGACRGPDFCAAGVLPGDIFELEPLEVAGLPQTCAAFVASDGRDDDAGRATLEYEVCEIAPNHLRVAPFSVGCAEPSERTDGRVATLPPPECAVEPFVSRVRSGDWLVRTAGRVGPSPYRSVDGVCAFHPEAEARLMRAALDEPFTTPSGPTFTLESRASDEEAALPAYRLYPRDFSVQFEIDRNFTLRTESSRQFLLGPASSAMAVADTDRGRRIAIVDESRSILWLYNAATYTTAADPLR